MKSKFLFFLGLIICSNLFSQINVTMETSKLSTKNSGSFSSIDVNIYDIDENYVYGISKKSMYSYSASNWIVSTYDRNNFNLVSQTPFFGKTVMGLKNPKVFNLDFYDLNGKSFVAFDIVNNKTKTKTYYAQYVKNGQFDGEPVELATIPYASGWGYFKPGIGYSNNSSYITTIDNSNQFYIDNYVWDKEKKEDIHSTVFFNENFENLGERKIELPYDEEKIRFKYSDMDEDGNLYYLVELLDKDITKGNKKEKLRPDDLIYNFVVYNVNENEPQEFNFKIDYFVTSCRFKVSKGIIYCAGFWGKKGEYEISGSFSCKYNAETGEEISIDTKEFDESFIEEFYSEKEVSKAEKKGKDLEVPHIVFHDILVNKDGSYYVVGEYYYNYTVCHTTRNGTVCHTYYVHNDIIVIKIDKDGEIEWTNKIPRRSVTGMNALNAYVYKHIDDQILFMYYDNAENFNEKNPREIKGLVFSKKAMTELIGATIDLDGEVVKQSIYTQKEPEYELTIYPGMLSEFDGDFYGIGIEEAGKITTKRRVLVKLNLESK